MIGTMEPFVDLPAPTGRAGTMEVVRQLYDKREIVGVVDSVPMGMRKDEVPSETPHELASPIDYKALTVSNLANAKTRRQLI
jgi:hypothetical protein